ncbi:MAG: dephospho-CoA kinase, partial [Wenzhouxiangellaceae bacterium]
MDKRQRSKVVVLTGGIASGKTAVSDAFARLGAPVIDTDVLARELVEPGSPALQAIARQFGQHLLQPDGALDRRALRERIFSDDDARRQLEGILHPRIADEARRRIERIDASYAILVVPLLIESGLFGDADEVVVVDVPEQVQIERLMARDGSTREQAEAALAAQASRR